jgi:hypothetical protein
VSNKPKRTVDYFPHLCIQKDSLRIIENTWGPKGYACWFKLLERLGATPDHQLSMENDKKKIRLIWSESQLKQENGEQLFDEFAELGMIDKELFSQRIVWSQNFIDGISVVYKNRKRDLPQKPNSNNMNLFSTDDNEISTGQKPGSREEKSKEEKKRIYYENGALHLEEKEVEYFKKAFPLKNVVGEVEKMGRWLYANPSKRYTNWRKFINNWLERADEEKNESRFNGGLS